MKKKFNIPKPSFGHRFAMLHRLLMAMCRADILNAGIQPSQMPFLAKLVREESPVTQDYLSRSLAIDKGTTARAVSKLEKTGLVVREPNPENRRQNLVSITPKGHDVIIDLFTSVDNAMNLFVQGFTEKECDTVLNLMDRMIANAQGELNERCCRQK